MRHEGTLIQLFLQLFLLLLPPRDFLLLVLRVESLIRFLNLVSTWASLHRFASVKYDRFIDMWAKCAIFELVQGFFMLNLGIVLALHIFLVKSVPHEVILQD